MPAEQATDLDPAKFAFVVLSDTVAPPTLFERTLTQYVAGGGSVLIALGTGAAHHGQIPIWGGQVQQIHDYARAGAPPPPSPRSTSPTPPSSTPNPTATTAVGPTQRSSTPPRWTEQRPAPPPALNDGTPLLLDRSLGEGHILLFATGFDNLTNDLPLHPIFVVFVDRAARYLSGNERLSGSRLVDSYVPLRSASQPVRSSASVEVVDPEGHRPSRSPKPAPPSLYAWRRPASTSFTSLTATTRSLASTPTARVRPRPYPRRHPAALAGTTPKRPPPNPAPPPPQTSTRKTHA